MPRMKKRDLVGVVEEHLARSTWLDGGEVQQNQIDALDSYYARAVEKATDGLSTARSTDVSDMVEAVVAQIMPAFDFDEVALCDPNGSDDVDQARHESIVCNTYLRDRNEGYCILQDAIRNALILRNGVVKVFKEEQTTTETRRFADLSAIEAQSVTSPTHPNQTVEVLSSSPAEGSDGVDVTVRYTTVFRRLTKHRRNQLHRLARLRRSQPAGRAHVRRAVFSDRERPTQARRAGVGDSQAHADVV